MKHAKYNRFFLIVMLTLCAVCLFAGSVLADCDCLAANGQKYPDSTVGEVPCYQCPEEGTCEQVGTLLCTGIEEEPTAVPQPTAKPTEKAVKQETAEKKMEAAQPTAVPTAVPTATPVPEEPEVETEEPVVEEPVVEEPVVEEPVVEEPVVEEPVVEEPVVEEPVVEEPVVEEPVVEEPVVEEPVVEEPVVEEPVVEEPVVEEPVVEEPVVEEPVVEEPAAEESAAEPTEEDPAAEESEVTEEPTDAAELTEEDPAAEDPEATEVPTDEAEPTEEDPAAEDPETTEVPTDEAEPTEADLAAEDPEATEAPTDAAEPTEEDPAAEDTEATEAPTDAAESEETAAPEGPAEEASSTEEPTAEPTVEPTAKPTAAATPQTGLVILGVEGQLRSLGGVSPASGAVLTSVPVTFTWDFNVQEPSSGTYNVDFTLYLTIVDSTNAQTTQSSTTISSTKCSAGSCTYKSGAELNGVKEGVVTWYVSGTYTDENTEQTINTDIMSFTIHTAPAATPTPTATPLPLPDAPVQECPKGRYLTRGLGFYWAPAKNAESYIVSWNNDKGQNGTVNLDANDSTCRAKRCVAHTLLPGPGNYTWNVSAVNSTGKTTSKNMKFEIASNITTPTPYKPNGTIVNRSYPSFQWEDVEDGAVEYRIQIVRKYDGRVWIDNWYSVDRMYVGNGVCEVQTDLFLPAGTYSWRVQARNDEFSSGWSSWLDFYVECDYCNTGNVYSGTYTYTNTVPSTVYPANTTITSLTPDYQWRPMTGISYYRFKLLDAKGTQLLTEDVAPDSCTTEVCTYTPQYQLPGNGTYSWTVEAYGGNGGLWGTSSGSFTAQAVIELKELSFISPEQNGYLDVAMPLVIWTDPGETATVFRVAIWNEAGDKLLETDLNREAAWCDGETCSIQFGTIPDGENYKIAVMPYSDQYIQGKTAELIFSKGPKPLELISPKEDGVVSVRPMFRWALGNIEESIPDSVDTSAISELSYEITMRDADNQVLVLSVPACGKEGVTCEDEEEFFVPSEAIPAGEYAVRLGIRDVQTNSPEIHITVQE